jgi:hypothetical protein
MSVKISQLNDDVSVATLVSTGGSLPVVASNLTTGNLMTYQVSLTNLKSFITTGDITYSGNVTVNGTLFAPNQTTVTLTSVSSASNLIEVQTDANLTLPNVITANNKSVGVRLYYVANAAPDVAALVLQPDTNYLTWFGSGASNANGVISANSILGTFSTGEVVVGNATNSISSTTGALRVAGGVGVAGNIHLQGILTAQGDINGNVLTATSILSNTTLTTPVATISNYITADKLIVNTTSTLTGNVTTLAEVSPISNLSGTLGNTTNRYNNIFAGNGYIDLFALTANAIVPTAANVANIGNTANWFSNAHISTINTRFVIATNVTAGNLIGTVISSNVRAGILSANGNITAANLNANTSVVAPTGEFATSLTVSQIVKTGTSNIGNIGQIDNRFNTLHAKATSAQYADLAEIYVPDSQYDAGTVVIFGGSAEITVTTINADTRVAGAISTNPAYLMNGDEQGLPLALRGKIPVNVKGPVQKGDLLVTSDVAGYAVSVRNLTESYDSNAVFAKSLENSDQQGLHKIWAMIL